MFENDPKYRELKRIREEEGYDGPLDHDGTRSDPLSPRAQAADALRRTGA
ncbi:hypothetical protein ABZ917_17170 [Nonomuraea wenchangensis]